jgi:TMEM175 potassium channel family protein
VAFEEVGDPAETRSEREFDYDRTVALSDGVFAIALTLLILNVNERAIHGGFLNRLSDVAPEIVSYALSFAVLGLLWLRHHSFFRDLRRIDPRMAFLNLVYLGLIAFIPYPTSLLADDHGRTFAAVAYATTLGLSALVSLLIRVHARRARLVRGVSARESLFRTGSVAAVFGLSIPIAFLNPDVAKYCWLLLFLTGVAERRLFLRRERAGGGS